MAGRRVNVAALLEHGTAAAAEPERTEEQVVRVDPRRLRVAANIRSELGDLTDLVASIRERGVLQSLRITPDHVVVCGHRRLAAALEVGLETVPAIVTGYRSDSAESPARIIREQLAENVEREDLAVLDEARSYERLQELGDSQREIGRTVGRSQSHVSKTLSLLRLPQHALDMLATGTLTREDAYEVARLAGDETRVNRALAAMGEGTAATEAVAPHLAALERDRTAVRSISQLRALGVRIIEAPRGDDWMTSTSRPLNSPEYGALPVSVGAHQRQRCHAGAVSRLTGEIVYVCTDPGRHGAAPLPTKAAATRNVAQRNDATQRETLTGDPELDDDMHAALEAREAVAEALAAEPLETARPGPQDRILLVRTMLTAANDEVAALAELLGNVGRARECSVQIDRMLTLADTWLTDLARAFADPDQATAPLLGRGRRR